jgi:hypothetical protein
MKYLMDFLTFSHEIFNGFSGFLYNKCMEGPGGLLWQGQSFDIRFLQIMPDTEGTINKVLQSVHPSGFALWFQIIALPQ